MARETSRSLRGEDRRGALAALLDADPGPGAYALALALALAFAFHLYPLSFFMGEGAYFQRGDAPQHVSGWLFFAQDPWRLPLLWTTRVDPPAGISIAFTDSIPLAALLAKPFVGVLPDGWHYFGWWHLLIKLSQAVAAVYVLRGLGARSWVGALAAAGLVLLWPAQLERMHHTALGTHSVILFALGFYIRARRVPWSELRSTAAFTGLSVCALLIHPYLVAMAYPFFLALLADEGLAGRNWARIGLRLAASLAAIALVAWPLGYFVAGGAVRGGFALYSMNLVSPFCGGTLLSCVSTDATGGQYEGMNLLGAGVLLVIALALVVGWRRIPGALRFAPGLALVLAGFFVYALSNEVYAGAVRILAYPLPPGLDALTGFFRASGRFFWPVGYALVVLALLVLLERRRLWVLPVLALALGLQWVDTARFRHHVVQQAHFDAPFDFDQWADAFPPVEAVNIYPPYGCYPIEDFYYVYFAQLAARTGATINTSYTAGGRADCAERDLPAEPPAPRTLYVSLANYADGVDTPKPIARRDGTPECRRWGEDELMIMCLAKATEADWEGLRIGNVFARVDIAALGHLDAQQVFIAVFGRPATAEEAEAWHAAVDGRYNLVAHFIALSEQAAEREPDQTVAALYPRLFGRAADPAGLDHYARRLDEEGWSVSAIAIDMANGAMGPDRVALSNKIVAAARFSERLEALDAAAAFTGLAASRIGGQYLASVTADPASIPGPRVIDACIAALADPVLEASCP